MDVINHSSIIGVMMMMMANQVRVVWRCCYTTNLSHYSLTDMMFYRRSNDYSLINPLHPSSHIDHVSFGYMMIGRGCIRGGNMLLIMYSIRLIRRKASAHFWQVAQKTKSNVALFDAHMPAVCDWSIVISPLHVFCCCS